MTDGIVSALIAALAGMGVGGGGLLVIFLTFVRGYETPPAPSVNLAFSILDYAMIDVPGAPVKKALVDANDKIAKENGIAVRNRKEDNANKSGFTGLQKRLRELNIKEAEVNFYDQLKSEGTQWAANMSLKAIKENGFFDEND